MLPQLRITLVVEPDFSLTGAHCIMVIGGKTAGKGWVSEVVDGDYFGPGWDIPDLVPIISASDQFIREGVEMHFSDVSEGTIETGNLSSVGWVSYSDGSILEAKGNVVAIG